MDDVWTKTFLVVDDVKNIRSHIIEQLKEFGIIKVFEADGVPDAKEILSNNEVNFIISDWMMPEETGFDFLNYVRGNDNFKNLPFILLTTIGEENQILDAIMAGASNYLLKPWEKQDLKEKILIAWKKHSNK